MANDTITINRGDTYSRTINLLDSAGDAIDATGYTIYFTVRKNVVSTSSSSDTDALISETIAGDASGVHTLTVTAAETNIDPGNYFYDIQIKKSDDTISSSTKASFIINGDVTRAV